jgi:hypothetical protein
VAFIVQPTSAVIAPGDSASLTVTAHVPSSATAGTVHSATLRITTNDAANRRTDISLTVTPQGATLAFPGGSRKQVDFGAVPFNMPSEAAVVLDNVGNAAATFAFGMPRAPNRLNPS